MDRSARCFATSCAATGILVFLHAAQTVHTARTTLYRRSWLQKEEHSVKTVGFDVVREPALRPTVEGLLS
jgi:hypothetical protein